MSGMFASITRRKLTAFFIIRLLRSPTPRCHCRPRAIGGGSDRCNAVSGPLVALVCCFDVPDIGLERIAVTADAHLCKVADCVLCFRKACIERGLGINIAKYGW